jgi:hypothetical protein
VRDEKHEQNFDGENWEGTTNKRVYIKSNSIDTDFGDMNYINCTYRAKDGSCWSLSEMLLNLRFCDSREVDEQVNMS